MLPADLESVSEKHFNSLVDGGVRESRTIEFKEALTIGTDSEKKEFLADVSSFANADGGDLIIGIRDSQGVASKVVGIEGFDTDRDLLRIEEIIRNGIDPRIIGLQTRSVELSAGCHAVVIRIPNSFNRPHMVVFKGALRFYSRNSAGKYPLDVHELRAAFIASESLSERIRQFRLERIDAILQGNTPEPVIGSHRVCLHLIPLEAFNPCFFFDILRAQKHREKLRPIYSSGWNPGTNFDGLLTSSSVTEGQSTSYVQLFRNGVIEAVEGRMLTTEGDGKTKTIPSIAYELEIISALDTYRDFYRGYGMPTPVLVGLSLLNVRGFHMNVGPSKRNDSARLIDRDHLILPDRVIETYEFEPATFWRPCFDQIWNACGWSRDINYDEKGVWNPRN